MLKIKSKLMKLLVTPKRVIFNKINKKINNISALEFDRNQDEITSTYEDYSINQSLKLNTLNFIDKLNIEQVLLERQILDKNVKKFLLNTYNILGSGDTIVSHSGENGIYEGIQFSHNINYNSKSDFIEKYINKSNQPYSLEIISKISDNYELIDWQKDIRTGFRWSENKWYKDIRYGNIIGADIKVPWEIGRMQWLPALAMKFYLSEGLEAQEYLTHIENNILDFIASNPPRYGTQWMTSMDVAIRIINWIVTIDIVSEKSHNVLKHKDIIINSIYQHIYHIYENLEYSEGQRGNHYLANIVGLYIASNFFNDEKLLPFKHFSEIEIFNEIEYQFNGDGSNFEASIPYHFLSFELISIALEYIDKTKIPQEIKDKLNKINDFNNSTLIKDDNKNIKTIFQIGDNDSGVILNFNYWQSNYFNNFIYNSFKSIRTNHVRLFEDFGIVTVTMGRFDFVLRNGDVGQNGKGGHSHNDNLSICLCVDGHHIIADPGTYNYTSFPELRNNFRSVKSHNTITKEHIEPNLIIEDSKDDLFWLYEQSNPKLSLQSDSNIHKIKATHTGFDNEAKREVEIIENQLLFSDSLEGEFDLLLHFYPNNQLNLKGNQLTISIDNEKFVDFSFDCNEKQIKLSDYYYSSGYGEKEIAKYVKIKCLDLIKWKITIDV